MDVVEVVKLIAPAAYEVLKSHLDARKPNEVSLLLLSVIYQEMHSLNIALVEHNRWAAEQVELIDKKMSLLLKRR